MELQELCSFMNSSSRPDIKATTLDYVLGLTGSKDGCQLLLSNENVLKCILELTTDEHVSRESCLTLLNLTAYHELSNTILIQLDTIQHLLQLLIDSSQTNNTKYICMTLSNLTRSSEGSAVFTDTLLSSNHSITLINLIDLFDKKDTFDSMDYLATIFSNITQIHTARNMFLQKQREESSEECIILTRLIPHIQQSLIRRGGIIGLVRNLCFEIDHHQWLLSDDIDLLPLLLLPLMGPEQYTDKENDTLPIDCQYQPDDKQREQDPDLRKMLLEAIMKLCATPFGRGYLKERGVYYILRELHKWEQDSNVLQTCENVVSILICDEPKDEKLQNLDKIETEFDTTNNNSDGSSNITE